MFIKKIIIMTILFSVSTIPCAALEFDVSVDEEIKKKYNSSKLEYDVLPALPKVNDAAAPTTKLEFNTSSNLPEITKVQSNEGFKISAGTKFSVKSNLAISDWQSAGTKVSFTTVQPVYKKFVTIPAGTVFRGEIVNSHQPQFTGNGGLVVIKLSTMTYKGHTYEIEAKITKANSKKIFLNNMKGKRKYWNGVSERITQGEIFYAKSKQKANKLANNPVFIILSPIPTIVGIAGCTVCTVLSPITAITTKGGHLSIPTGSSFEIKLLEPAYVK